MGLSTPNTPSSAFSNGRGILSLSWSSAILLSILLIAFALRVYIAWIPPGVSFGLAVPDDAYYYFTIARNISAGHGVSADGFEPTNGFHPLWMILLVPLWLSSPSNNPELPVHLALTLGALFDLVTMGGLGWLAFRLTRSRAISILTVVAYAFNPYAVAAAVNGLETSAANALLVLALIQYWRVRGRTGVLATRQVLLLFLLWSLVSLARTDYLLVLAPCILDWAWSQRRHLKNYIFPGLGAALLWLPWLVWNLETFDTVIQVSALAYPYYRHLVWDAQPHTFFQSLAHEGELAYHTVGLIALISGFGRIGLVSFVIALLLGPGMRTYYARRTEKFLWRTAPWAGLVLPTIGLLVYLFINALVRWQYALWYFAPVPILFLLWFAVLLKQLAQWRRALMYLVWALYIGFQVWSGADLWNQGGVWREQRVFAESQMPDMLELCREYGVLGISDSGYVGYFLPCRVINLDGVVNNAAYHAIQQGSFRSYLDSSGIQYVLMNQIVRDAVAVKEGAIPTLPPYRTDKK